MRKGIGLVLIMLVAVLTFSGRPVSVVSGISLYAFLTQKTATAPAVITATATAAESDRALASKIGRQDRL